MVLRNGIPRDTMGYHGIPWDTMRPATSIFEYQTIYSYHFMKISWILEVFWSFLSHFQRISIRRQPLGAGNTPPPVSAFLSSALMIKSPKSGTWHGHFLCFNCPPKFVGSRTTIGHESLPMKWLKSLWQSYTLVGTRNFHPPVCDEFCKNRTSPEQKPRISGFKCWSCWLTLNVLFSASPFSVVLARALSRNQPSLNCFTPPPLKHIPDTETQEIWVGSLEIGKDHLHISTPSWNHFLSLGECYTLL